MAERIVIFERTLEERTRPHPSDPGGPLGPFAWSIRGVFLYPFAPTMETKGPNAGRTITPTPSQMIPQKWRGPINGLDLFRATELAALDDGTAVFTQFDTPLTEAQADDPAGAGRALLRQLYVDSDPRERIRFQYAHTGARADES